MKFIFLMTALLNSYQGPKSEPVSAQRVDVKAIIAKMHSVCASLGDTMEATDNGKLGDDDTEFACKDKQDVWYWIRWGDVKSLGERAR